MGTTSIYRIAGSIKVTVDTASEGTVNSIVCAVAFCRVTQCSGVDQMAVVKNN